jgi:hypothetical protein
VQGASIEEIFGGTVCYARKPMIVVVELVRRTLDVDSRVRLAAYDALERLMGYKPEIDITEGKIYLGRPDSNKRIYLADVPSDDITLRVG